APITAWDVQAVRNRVADLFVTDYMQNPGRYAEFGILPEQVPQIERDMRTLGVWRGVAGDLMPLLAALAFTVDLVVVEPDGRLMRPLPSAPAGSAPVYVVRVGGRDGHWLATVGQNDPPLLLSEPIPAAQVNAALTGAGVVVVNLD